MEKTEVEERVASLKRTVAQALRAMERVTEKDGSRWVDSDDVDTLALRLETDPTWL